MKVSLTNVRLAFPALFEPKTVNGEGEPRFSAVAIIDPASINVKNLDAAVKAVATEKWKDKAPAILQKLVSEGRVAFHKAAKTNSSGEVYAGFEDTFHLNASNKARPLVIDSNKSPLTAADGRPYAGCFVNMSIELWAQDNNFGKRVNATLRGVQFVRDGDAFTGGLPASADEFEDLAEGATADDLA